MRGWRTRTLAALLAVALAAGGCATGEAVRNPATGEVQRTSMTPAQEREIGAQEHPKVMAQFGGPVADRELQGYVTRLGRALAANSELPAEQFTFTLLDTDLPNAFALPGGYVYITRGILALANNEAEVAGVLGHEIGHVTARHTAQRLDRAQAGTLGATAATIGGLILGGVLGGQGGAELGGRLGQQLGGVAATAYVQGYSREQEFEADQLGIRYLARTGYEPMAMATFLESLALSDRLNAQRTGRSAEAGPSWLASHPRTPDRIVRAAQAAEGGSAGRTERAAFLRAIDGMVYGDSPEQGFIDGTSFVHPVMRFRFDAPEGTRLVNQPTAVLAQGQSRLMRFDIAEAKGDASPARYLQDEFTAQQRLRDVQSLTVDGRPAALGFGQAQVQGRAVQAMFGAIAGEGRQLYRFVYLSPDMRRDLPAFERSFRSFARLSAQAAARYQPLRIRIVTVGANDTIDTLARRMEVPELPRETFLTLNKLDAGARLERGQQVKIVTRG
jgi:predicted Zn-dependent protease